MTNELNAELIGLVADARTAGKGIVAAIYEQAPELAQQLVYSKLLGSLSGFFGFGFVGLLFIYLTYRVLRAKDSDDREFFWMPAGVAVITLSLSVGNVFQAARCFVAPKVVVLESVADILKSK